MDILIGEGIKKSFKGRVVLDGVNINIKKGEIASIIGTGGSGKSVLIKILCTLLPPDEGRVILDGEEIHDLSSNQMRRVRQKFGMLFQNFALFDFLNVFENVAFPLRQMLPPPSDEEIKERVEKRLEDVGLIAAKLKKISELSGGMQRRVALARATITDAPIIIYDGPTEGIDPVTSSKIFRLIKNLHIKNRSTSIIISSDIDRLKDISDTFYLLRDGKVYFEGNFNSAINSKDAFVTDFFSGQKKNEKPN